MERRFAVHAGAYRQALIAAILLASAPVSAAPKGEAAKALFDRGVAAFSSKDYAAASEALGKSYDLEGDAETLFAWAQAERKLDHCAKAVELYENLLAYDLPAENRKAINAQILECQDIIGKQQPAEPASAAASGATPAAGDATALSGDRPEMPPEGRPWWRDPVGDSLVVLGVAGLATGVVFLVSAHSAEQDKANAASYFEFRDLDDRAKSRGQMGVIAAGAGGALVAAGIVWYATHRAHPEEPVVSGWVAPGSGGLAVAGRF